MCFWIDLEPEEMEDGKKRALMIVYNTYPFDPRVKRSAETLVERGFEVDVICTRDEGETVKDSFLGVGIYRMPLALKRGGYGRYVYQYLALFLLAFGLTSWLFLKRRYHVVHVNSLPDFLVFVAIIPKLLGAKIILDLHEAMPEIFAARFNQPMESWKVGIAKFLEKISINFSHAVITINETAKGRFVERGTHPDKITVVMNSPKDALLKIGDTDSLSKKYGTDGCLVTVYAGGINSERDLEVIIKAAVLAKSRDIPIKVLIFGYGKGAYKEKLKKLIKERSAAGYVLLEGRLEPEEVATYLSLSHFGIVSYKDNPLTQVAVPNKAFEYIALDKPLIIAKLDALEKLFGSDCALFYTAEDPESLAEKIGEIYRLQGDLRKRKENARRVYDRCKWSIMADRLVGLYRTLVGN